MLLAGPGVADDGHEIGIELHLPGQRGVGEVDAAEQALQRLAHQLRHSVITDRSGTAWAQPVMHSRHALLHETSPPFAHGRVGQSQLPGNLLVHLSRRVESRGG